MILNNKRKAMTHFVREQVDLASTWTHNREEPFFTVLIKKRNILTANQIANSLMVLTNYEGNLFIGPRALCRT